MLYKINDNSHAEFFEFVAKHGVKEYQIMIHADNLLLDYEQQLKSINDTHKSLCEERITDAKTTFERYFLSDASNQAEGIYNITAKHDYALSIIQQPPLNGSKVALWIYMQTNVSTNITKSGIYEVRHGVYRHLWNASMHNLGLSSEYQTNMLLNEYSDQLKEEGCSLEKNCIRTWFFVNSIDLNYGGIVRARNNVFFSQGLTPKTHFIASTGIGGRQEDANVLSQMDNYAIAGIRYEQIKYLYAPKNLNRTSDYGVSFERGTAIDYGDRRHVFISGTASINNKGEIMFPGDIKAQTERTIENISALLEEAECTLNDVAQLIVYLRDAGDYKVVKHITDKYFHDKPVVIVNAPVCRPGWLIEMECIAMKEIHNPEFPDF